MKVSHVKIHSMQSSVSQPDQLTQQLKSVHVADLANFRAFCLNLVQTDQAPYSVTKGLLLYIIHTMPPKHIAWKLQCIQDIICPHIQQEDTELWPIIVAFCLKTRYNEAMWILELWGAIYSILKACPSLATVYADVEPQIPYLKEKMDARLCDKILEECIHRPTEYKTLAHDFEEKIPTSVIQASLPIQIRLGLYRSLHETELISPLFFHDAFPFSDTWTTFLNAIKPFARSFVNEITFQAENLQQHQFKVQLKDLFHETIPIVQEVVPSDHFPMLLRECCLSLSTTNPRFIALVTFCMIHLLKYVRQTNDESKQIEHMRLCQSTWYRLFLTTMDESVFNKTPDVFYKLAPCFMYYRAHIGLLTESSFHTSVKEMWEQHWLEMDTLSVASNSVSTMEKIIRVSVFADLKYFI